MDSHDGEDQVSVEPFDAEQAAFDFDAAIPLF